ncbi:unnamed protein product [Cuscuta europaea]|uniref:Uncharacterized protein n=1 Tax=Cuscuta europaea TaxID=41803 RepID=A0A9P1DWH1_CUSEU|nr:unnamed protein product [Cuscuta europaea]
MSRVCCLIHPLGCSHGLQLLFETINDRSICIFHKPVALRVSNRRSIGRNSPLPTKVFEGFRVKLFSIIKDNFHWNTKLAEYIPPNKPLALFSSNGGHWFGLNPLSEITNSDYKELPTS